MVQPPTTPTDALIEIKLIIHSFLVGCLCSCPIITCILLAAFPGNQLFLPSEIIFSWILIGFQICMLLLSFKWPTTTDLSFLSIVDPLCHILLLFTFISPDLAANIPYATPILSLLTTSALAMINTMSYQLVYLCPDIYQRYYELGLLVSSLTYTYITRLNWVSSVSTLIPFYIFFHLGLHSLRALSDHPVLQKAIARCKTYSGGICKNRACSSSLTSLSVECLTEVFLVLAFLSLALLTVTTLDYSRGLRPAGDLCFLVYIGNFCLMGLMVFRGSKTGMCFVFPMAAVVVLLHLYTTISPGIQDCLLNGLYLLFFNAIGYQLYSIRVKSNHNILCPRFTLMISLVTNIAVTLPQLVLLTVRKYLC
ncbi:BMFR2 [Phascolarctid gammaherpesvirus 1]|uniref:BMFR2 n=1 Tax=Phascolarctid gammaherpesvirus 1 TaxID=2249313 RepID=A0A3S5HA20_9GAMA|nr:BMFR2 [Phascolarctid gammaherpesvirus 1]AZB49229.1 BMFR2 [Phascolarctid gammaherpesvirus 1]